MEDDVTWKRKGYFCFISDLLVIRLQLCFANRWQRNVACTLWKGQTRMSAILRICSLERDGVFEIKREYSSHTVPIHTSTNNKKKSDYRTKKGCLLKSIFTQRHNFSERNWKVLVTSFHSDSINGIARIFYTYNVSSFYSSLFSRWKNCRWINHEVFFLVIFD